jgi:hypothetical protein
MINNPIVRSNNQYQLFPERPIWRWSILFFLFVIALAIRIYGIGEYPLDIHPVKQYRSALTARLYYYEGVESIPDWKKEVARKNVQLLGSLGPTLVENIAAFTHRLAGAERLWIPRFLSSIYWVIGGIFLYLLALKLSSFDGAIISTAFYLFLPTGILLSQSFQPDPLMIMLMIMSLYAVIQQYQHPTTKGLVLAAAIAGAAILVKPVSLFFIFGSFVSLSVYQHGIYRMILRLSFWVFTLLALFPTLLYYGYGIFISGALQGQADTSFIPKLLFEPYFWQFWLKHIYRMIGFAALIGGMFGILLFRADWRRVVIIGLWSGYFLYGLVFTYHIHTHNYYQLPFIPVIALSLAPLGALFIDNLLEINSHWSYRPMIVSILVFAVVLQIGLFVQVRQDMPDYEREVRIAEEIGEAVDHSTQTLILAPFSGSPLKYHGELAGWPWPTQGDINADKLVGKVELSVEARFKMLKSIHEARYFIVTDFNEFTEQKELREFLMTNYPIILQKNNYMIFDIH